MSDSDCTGYQQARLSWDARFDGQFSITVKTPDVFWQTNGPTKLPLEKNGHDLATREQAVVAGFRPGLHCKPEYASCYDRINPANKRVRQVVQGIQSGAYLFNSVQKIATQVQTFARNLHNRFNNSYAMPVKAYQGIYKSLFAAKLLFSAHLSLAEIAESCGYCSANRLYRLITQYLKTTPPKLSERSPPLQTDYIRLTLPSLTPSNWLYFSHFQGKRAITDMAVFDDDCYFVCNHL